MKKIFETESVDTWHEDRRVDTALTGVVDVGKIINQDCTNTHWWSMELAFGDNYPTHFFPDILEFQ